MKKLECMENYYMGPLSLFIHFYNDALYGKNNNPSKFLNDEKNIMSSIVSLISVTMLGIKEDIVQMNQDMSFSSKLLISSLEKTVSIIAVKKNDKFYIDGYEFSDSATLVNVLRNKLAHGNFYIDYKNNKVILLHDGCEISINIDKLATFIISAFRNSLRDLKSNKCERSFCGYHKVFNNRSKSISTLSEVKDIIRNIRYYSFKLETDNGVISRYCLENFHNFVSFYNKNINMNKEQMYKIFTRVEEFFKVNGCTLTMYDKKVATKDIENKLIVYANRFLINNLNLEYEDQIKLLMNEALKHANNEYKTFEPLSNNIKLLILLDVLKTKGSLKRVDEYFYERGYSEEISLNYDAFAIILINLFNTVFIYGYDDVLTSPGGYKLDRSEEFDFGVLDFSNLFPIKDGIDYTSLKEAKKEYGKLRKRSNSLNNEIKKRQSQLDKTKDEVGKNRLINFINELKSDLIIVDKELVGVTANYTAINNDYVNNFNYFKNKAIVNGIRNSIAHGNFEVISGDGIGDSKIIFTDIYDGRETFKIEVTFDDFLEMLKKNSSIILDYVDEKKKKVKKEYLFKLKQTN